MAEITINQLPPEVRRLHTKAIEAAQRENHDYAMTLFAQVLSKHPGFFEGRKQLRAAQLAKAGAQNTGFFKKMLSGAGSSPQIAKAKMAMSKNPAEAMAIAEEVLNADPHTSAAYRIIADAAVGLELPQTRVFALESLARISPKDKAAVMEFAEAASETGANTDAAEKVLNELIRASGYDQDLLQLQKNLSAHKTMKDGGYDKAGSEGSSFRDMLKNKDESVALEQENKVQKSEDQAARLIAEYESRLPKEPENFKMLRSLAELYTQKSRFDEALEIYARIKNSPHGNDPSLDQAMAATQVRKFDFAIAQVNPFAPEHAEQVTQITAQKAEYQIAECKQRVEKYPTDMAIRFEMGQLYFQAGKINEAIGEFQKAQGNPHKRLAAMSFLAQCFAKKGMNDSAVRTLQNAIKEKPGFDEEKKDLIYNLGSVLEQMGKKAEALEQFLIIWESDISYRDVAAKVESLSAGQ
ncbi:MAG TPA: tetratricopeptide repeat protein [Candidatus Sulfotelmatobacter sp.]|nr:tetratricopeptide repeat protein [Candidatus Sulfotelmatobacter sp.]